MHDDPFARAVERVEAKEQAEKDSRRQRRQDQYASGNRTAFRIHSTVFVAVNLLLIAIWASIWQLNGGTSYPWFIWVLLGWGIGLAAHWAAARNHLRAESSGSSSKELARLAQLHRDGSLDDAEFQAAKAKLLA